MNPVDSTAFMNNNEYNYNDILYFKNKCPVLGLLWHYTVLVVVFMFFTILGFVLALVPFIRSLPRACMLRPASRLYKITMITTVFATLHDSYNTLTLAYVVP